MKNSIINHIKAVLFDLETLSYCNNINCFLLEIKKYGVKTILCVSEKTNSDIYSDFDMIIEKRNYAQIEERIGLPRFHCIAFDNTENGVEYSKIEKINLITIGKENYHAGIPNINALEDIDLPTFVKYGVVAPYEVEAFSFIEKDILPHDSKHVASLFALGNGYLGLRGTYEESDCALPEDCGMYINGVFEKKPIPHVCKFKGFAENSQFTVNLPDWRIIEVIVDGEKACLSNGGMLNHKRILDLKNGYIIRSFEYSFKSGKKIKVQIKRVVSMTRLHLAAIEFDVIPVNFSGIIQIKSVVVKEPLTSKKKAIYTDSEELRENGILINSKTYNTNINIATNITHSFNKTPNIKVSNEENYELNADFMVSENENLSMVKYASFYTSIDNCDINSAAIKENEQAMCDGFELLLSEQKSFWNAYWEIGDIEIDGSVEDQQLTRFSLFHLRSQLSTLNDMSIGATGLTGPHYSGNVFWDTEMYLMPYYNFTYPETCKGLIKYRYRILDKARERAKQLDGVGALYSWCSIDGEETSVVFEASTAEYHINTAVAYAIWRYYKLTEDYKFVYKYGAEILFETAKFYAHRGQFIPERDNKFCINVVCGPDEYACGVNNNCYTNMMVQFHLKFALSIYEEMKQVAPEDLLNLVKKVGVNETELKLWEKAADNMYFYKNEATGVYAQDDNFFFKDSVDMSMIPMNYDMRADLHPLNLWRKQILKQADVVLINFIRGDIFSEFEKKQCFDYYEPKTNHGSSLSAAIHAIMANEVGYYQKAYDYFKSAVCMDVYDYKKNTNGGLHIACLGGVWMAIVNGFLGMRLYDDGLKFNIKIPEKWNKVKCKLFYKNSVFEVEARQDGATFTLLKGTCPELEINNKKYEFKNNKIDV